MSRSRGTKFHTLLRKPDKGQKDTADPLALIYRKILTDLEIAPLRWSKLLSDYCHKYRDIIGRRKVSDYQGNLTQAVTGDRMSWRNFQRVLMIHQAFKVELCIKFHWRNPKGEVKITEHTLEIKSEHDDDRNNSDK